MALYHFWLSWPWARRRPSVNSAIGLTHLAHTAFH